jgi:hypothetical protein
MGAGRLAYLFGLIDPLVPFPCRVNRTPIPGCHGVRGKTKDANMPGGRPRKCADKDAAKAAGRLRAADTQVIRATWRIR